MDKKIERNDPMTKLKEKIYKELKVTFQGIEQKIKEVEDVKAENEMKCELYGECLSEHLLSNGSDIVKVHLEEAHKAIEDCDKEIERLREERDAYRIEIEIFENNIK